LAQINSQFVLLIPQRLISSLLQQEFNDFNMAPHGCPVESCVISHIDSVDVSTVFYKTANRVKVAVVGSADNRGLAHLGKKKVKCSFREIVLANESKEIIIKR
jgi:hypothetical protein